MRYVKNKQGVYAYMYVITVEAVGATTVWGFNIHKLYCCKLGHNLGILINRWKNAQGKGG